MDDLDEKSMHNKERNLIKDGLNMKVFNHRLKFVNDYTFVSAYRRKPVHSPSSNLGHEF